jgi:hypothetical protein
VTIVITVTCEGLDHRLEFRDDGEVVMLDHSEKLVRSFVAFGAKPPECMEEIDKAREWPIGYLFDHLKADRKTIVLLACDFAEHVLPIWYEYYKDDDRPKKAIQASRKYLAGKIKLSTLERAQEAAVDAAEAASASAADAASAASVSARAAWWAAETASASAAADEAWAEAWAVARASAAAYRHAEARGDDPDAAMAAEKKWQASRMVQVLEAISRGEDPWRS